jgi:hypothetical protein
MWENMPQVHWYKLYVRVFVLYGVRVFVQYVTCNGSQPLNRKTMSRKTQHQMLLGKQLRNIYPKLLLAPLTTVARFSPAPGIMYLLGTYLQLL